MTTIDRNKIIGLLEQNETLVEFDRRYYASSEFVCQVNENREQAGSDYRLLYFAIDITMFDVQISYNFTNIDRSTDLFIDDVRGHVYVDTRFPMETILNKVDSAIKQHMRQL